LVIKLAIKINSLIVGVIIALIRAVIGGLDHGAAPLRARFDQQPNHVVRRLPLRARTISTRRASSRGSSS